VIITTQYFDDQVLLALTKAIASGGFTGPMSSTNLLLFSNGVLLTNQTPFSALTECVYSGYARKTGVVFSSPILQADNTYSILSNLYTFVAAAMSNFTNDQAAGWALIDNSNPPNLLMAERFAQNVPFISPGDGFGMVISFNFGQQNPLSFATVLA
jgi:hypothetical protein